MRKEETTKEQRDLVVEQIEKLNRGETEGVKEVLLDAIESGNRDAMYAMACYYLFLKNEEQVDRMMGYIWGHEVLADDYGLQGPCKNDLQFQMGMLCKKGVAPVWDAMRKKNQSGLFWEKVRERNEGGKYQITVGRCNE